MRTSNGFPVSQSDAKRWKHPADKSLPALQNTALNKRAPHVGALPALQVSRGSAGSTLNKFLIGGLAAAAVIATTSTVSLQDIADMTGANVEGGQRWVARLVSVPEGSTHAKVEDRLGQSDEEQVSKGIIASSVAVRTASSFHQLGSATALPETGTMTISRALKGDRVVSVAKDSFQVEQASWAVLKADSTVTGSVAKNANLSDADQQAENTNHLLRLAQTFRPTQSTITDTGAGVSQTLVAGNTDGEDSLSGAVRMRLASGQLQQARAAARLMANVVEKVKNDSSVIANTPSTVAAYAPAERDIASAFAAVLRPAEEPGRNRIRLRPGDHKWAANPLPKLTYSRAQRRCLANGIYFEARGEPLSGQKAVAQVILNRVKNPAYPNSVCGVVYQNKWKRNACQFSFACDGIRDRINSKKHWGIATKVANDAIDGKFWLTSVGSSSHYHADYVWPRWRRSMKKMVKIGRHIFYRTYGGGWS